MKQPRSVLAVVAFVLAALVLTVSGCDLDGKVKEYRDPAALIEVEKGDEFAIVLESNPTTGYQWKLAEPLEAEIVVLVKTEYEAPDTELLGAGGEEKWTFKAEGLGDTSITLAYVRPWEDADEELPPMEEADEEEVEEPSDQGVEDDSGEIVVDAGPETVTFNVRVKKEGAMDKDPKVFGGEDEEIEVEAGFKFAIALESNPTTGYSWRLSRPLDEDKVILLSAEFEKGSGGHGGDREIVGAPGEEVLTFEAIGEGDTEIELEYVRPWETGVAPEDTKTFKVKISPAHEGESGGH
jgi:inhibitor of cysteine peptidase